MCVANTIGQLIEKTTPRALRPFDLGHRLTKKAEDKAGYGGITPRLQPQTGVIVPRVDPAAAIRQLNLQGRIK
jgi:hypothetical protein